MAQVVYDKTDTDLDGTNDTVDRDTEGRQSEHLWHIVHDLNTTVDVNVYGTHSRDDDFSEAVTLPPTLNLASGGDQDFITLTDPWEQIRLEFVFGADPTSGSLTVYENAER